VKLSWTARLLLASCLCLLSALGNAASDPVRFLQNTASYVFEQVETRRAELEQDSSKIYRLVEKRVVPHFDFYTMSRAALGRHWRKATEKQRQRLVEEFQELLVRTYALALLNYSGQEIEYLPFRGDPNAQRIMVNTRVQATGGPPVPINYRLLKKQDSWLIYDVIIDGISLVSNYRSSFGAEVTRSGIDGLITTLAERNRKLSG
jgi:phospholipid transport system substrate-binding protein